MMRLLWLTYLISTGRRLARVFAVRLTEIVVRYAFNLMLALVLGVQGTGQFYIGMALISIASPVARFGIDTVAMKRLAVARQSQNAALARGIAVFAFGSTATTSAAISILLFLTAPFLGARLFGNPDFVPILRLFSFGILGCTVASTAGSLLSALSRPIAGQIVSAVIWPLLTTGWLLAAGGTVAQAALVAVLAMAAAALLGLALVWRVIGVGPLQGFEVGPVLAVAWPLFGVEVTYLLLRNLPILALGLVATDTEVGLLGLATQVSALLTVATIAVYAVAAPRLARLHEAGDWAGFTRAARAATRDVAVLALPAAAAMLLFPATILGLFGHAFRTGAPLLVVATLGQLTYAIFAQGNTMLAMSGNERWLWSCARVTLGVLVLALALLVPSLGALGAALAAAAATATMSLGSAVGVWRRLGLNILSMFAVVPLRSRMPAVPLPSPDTKSRG